MTDHLKLVKAIDEQILIVGSQNKLATKLGISSAQLTNIRTNKLDKVSHDMLHNISNQLGIFNGWRIASTTNLKRVTNICIHAQKFQVAKAISFAPGTGKTEGLKQYSKNTPNTYYVEAEEYWSKKIFLNEIRKSMGIDDGAIGINELIESIITKLNKIDKPLLIIDEADKLKDGVINLFKSLYNKSSCGFILSGTPHFTKRIKKGIRLKKMGYAEIYSRLGGEFLALHPISNNDIIAIASANNITDKEYLQSLINSNSGDLRKLKASIEVIQFKNKAL